jgi:hypothetical protein
MRPASDRRAALAPHRGVAARARDQRRDLVEAFFERQQLGAALRHELDPETIAAEHLEHEPAQIANALLAFVQQQAPLAPERLRTGRAPL